MKFGIIALALITAIITSPVLCDDWEIANHGITGYTVSDVIIDHSNPSILYASCKDGVYKSTDGGASWVKKSNGFPTTPYTTEMAMDPSNPNRIYVRAVEDGDAVVFRTDDGGDNWAKKDTGINHRDISTVEVSVSNPNIVYCGTVVGGRDGGCYRSTDYGDTWVQVSGSDIPGSGLGNDCAPIAIDPTDPDKVYAGKTHYTNFFKSIDGAATWNTTDTEYRVRGIAVNPSATNRVITCGDGILKLSTDYGQTFTKKITGQQLYRAAVAPSNSNIVYATTSTNGIYKSTDAGDTWNQMAGSEVNAYSAIAIHPTDPNIIYCVLPGRGVGKSTDSGATFALLNNGLPSEKNVWAIGTQPQTSAVYAFVNYVGFYRSFDEGASWQLLCSMPYYARSFDFSRQNPNTMYFVSSNLDAVWKSVDGGFNWFPLASTPGGDTYYSQIAVDPANENRIFVAGTNHTLYRTTNGGQSWEEVHSITPMPDWWSTSYSYIEFDPTNTDRVYLATYSWAWRSTDGGDTWTKLEDLNYDIYYGSPNPVLKNTSFVRDITVDPVSPNILYAATQWGGTWKSTDYGDTWSVTHNKILDTTNFTLVDSSDHNTVYLTSFGYSGSYYGVWKSTDSGANWAKINSGLIGNDQYPYLMCQSFANPDRIFISAQVEGVYRSTGGGWGLSIDDARALPDMGYCLLSEDAIVSIKNPDGSGCVQNPDRLRGMRVTNLGSFTEGDTLQIEGTIHADDADRVMEIAQANLVTSVDAPRALSMNGESLNDMWAPVGIFSRAWGTVTEVGPGNSYYYVDDGSGLVDGTAHAGVKIRCSNSPALAAGSFAVLEGAVGVSMQDGVEVPCLIPFGLDGILAGEVSNYCINPGFETGLSSWNTIGAQGKTTGLSSYGNIVPYSGGAMFAVQGYYIAESGTLYQQAQVEAGQNYSASVRSSVYHWNSIPEAARSRIGIDPTGGTDPNSGSVVWSAWDENPAWTAGWDTIGTAGVAAISDTVTVFLQYSQQGSFGWNINCFDDVALSAAP